MKVVTYELNSNADIDLHTGLGICHEPSIKLGGFQSWLEASCMSSITEM